MACFPFLSRFGRSFFVGCCMKKKSGTLIWMPDRLLLFDAHLYGFQVTGL